MSPWPEIPDRRIAIVGSVSLSPAQVGCAQRLIDFALSYEGVSTQPGQIIVVSGGADGIDTMAEETADAWSLEKDIYHPEKRSWYWFKKRNIKIAENCDILYRIASKESKTYGSGWTADYAESIGKEVYRYYV